MSLSSLHPPICFYPFKSPSLHEHHSDFIPSAATHRTRDAERAAPSVRSHETQPPGIVASRCMCVFGARLFFFLCLAFPLPFSSFSSSVFFVCPSPSLSLLLSLLALPSLSLPTSLLQIDPRAALASLYPIHADTGKRKLALV